MSIIFNDEQTQNFYLVCGLLSPYLFVLCVERLGQLIGREMEVRRWTPISLAQNVPFMSHLFFVNNLILFRKQLLPKLRSWCAIWMIFVLRLRGVISLEKSKILVSRNIHGSRAQSLSEIAGIQLTFDLDRYLGMPLLHS